MDSQEFVIESIKLITDCFPNIKCTYEHDEEASVHLIEVLPKGEFLNSEKYAAFESDIVLDFMSKYDDSNISFFTIGDKLGFINNPTYIATGDKFKSKSINNFSLVELEFLTKGGDNYGENNYAMAA